MAKNTKNKLVQRLKPKVVNPYGLNMLVTGQESATLKWLMELGMQLEHDMGTSMEKAREEGHEIDPDHAIALANLSRDLRTLSAKLERLYPTAHVSIPQTSKPTEGAEIMVDTSDNISKEK